MPTSAYQANVVHGDINNHYQATTKRSPEETFRTGVSSSKPGCGRRHGKHIAKAMGRGYDTDEVWFHWLLALLNGQTLRQLSNDETRSAVDLRRTSCPHGQDEWTAGLRAIRSLLSSADTAETDLQVSNSTSSHRASAA